MKKSAFEIPIYQQWLTAGYIEKQTLMPTREGTPQGGIISPTLANMVLDGLETLAQSFSSRKERVQLVRYADDFIITGTSKELLCNKVKPAIEQFLQERGLALSLEKTKLTHISAGFNFLGFNIRKYSNGKLLIKPAKESVTKFLQEMRSVIKGKVGSNAERLISTLNPKLRGWAYYYRHVVSKNVFSKMDHDIFLALYAWICRCHPKKSRKWRERKYFRNKGLRNWVFSARVLQANGQIKHLDLFNMGYLEIKRHRKIVAKATPFDPDYKEYFDQRKTHRKRGSLHHWIELSKLNLT